MRVKCVICDNIEKIDDETLIAKQLRNRPIHTYMCDTCKERIEIKTKERMATGKFKLYRQPKKEDDWF